MKYFFWLLLLVSCGPATRPNSGCTFRQTGHVEPRDSAAITSALKVWDNQGWPSLAIIVELRNPEPESLPPLCYGCDPWIYIYTNFQPQGQAVAFTLPSATIVCTRGSEWAIVHELLHILHQLEGKTPDLFHRDPRWPTIDRLSNSLR